MNGKFHLSPNENIFTIALTFIICILTYLLFPLAKENWTECNGSEKVVKTVRNGSENCMGVE